MTPRIGVVVAAMCLVSAAPAAQERVVVTGCLQLGDSLVGRPAAAAREPFVLTDVKREPARPMPIDAGPLAPNAVTAGGSVAAAPPLVPSAAGTSGRIPSGTEGVAVYAVDGDVKGLAKRVGRRVEIIGRLVPATNTEFQRVTVSGIRSLGTCQ